MTETISLLTILSLTAICTTISLFFCGLPICIEIYRRKSTDEISPFPFLMGLLGGAFWLRYGFLRADLTMISVNVVGVTLMFLYLVFYTYYSESRVKTTVNTLKWAPIVGMRSKEIGSRAHFRAFRSLLIELFRVGYWPKFVLFLRSSVQCWYWLRYTVFR